MKIRILFYFCIFTNHSIGESFYKTIKDHEKVDRMWLNSYEKLKLFFPTFYYNPHSHSPSPSGEGAGG